jgi:hypothetical protein
LAYDLEGLGAVARQAHLTIRAKASAWGGNQQPCLIEPLIKDIMQKELNNLLNSYLIFV